MPETEKPLCRICGGPHPTEMHNAWVEKPAEMTPDEIKAELEKYAPFLKAMQRGGIEAAEKALNTEGLTLKGEACFCGTPNHTGVDHLRWLADKKTEI